MIGLIPYAIMSMKIFMKEGSCQEVRILDLSVDSMTFRLKKPLEGDRIREIRLHYYLTIPSLAGEASGARELVLEDFTLEEVAERADSGDSEEAEPAACREMQESGFCFLYRIRSDQEDYHKANQRLMQAYMKYIEGKWQLEGAELARELTGYPADREEIYADSWHKERQAWYAKLPKLAVNGSESISLGLTLGNREAWQVLLSSSREEFLAWYWKSQGMETPPSFFDGPSSAGSDRELTHWPMDYLYLGNSSCYHLLPTGCEWRQLLEASMGIGCQPVILLPPLREDLMEEILRERIQPLLVWWRENLSRMREAYGFEGEDALELVVNDWGMVNACVRLAGVSITLGGHLNKYKKDVRLPWRHYGEEEYELLRESAGLTEEYLAWLQENHQVHRLTWEVCGYVPRLPVPSVDAGHPALGHTLHLPLMSMNTGGNCTLRAAWERGDRGHQTYDRECPEYCRQKVFLYPEFLGMVGRYNTLWGLDRQVLREETCLQEWIRQGITRIVWNGV